MTKTAEIKATAELLKGQVVRLRTNRGVVLEGELHTVGHASCVIGFGGRYAYGGIAAIEHACNGDPAVGPVCSHLATDDLLSGLGFPVKRVGKIVGGYVLYRDGTSREAAVSAAAAAGKVRTCTRTRRLA